MHSKPVVFMFSGQGSQYFGMGAELLASDPLFRRQAQALDELALDLLGFSLLALIHAPQRRISDPFDDVATSGAAIYLMERALTRYLLERGVIPAAGLGASMGLLAAATLGGCLDEEEALLSVYRQGRVFADLCEPGDMVAVLGSPNTYAEQPELRQLADLAGVNFDGGFVLSAPEQNLEALFATLTRHDLAYQRLRVARPFHSRWTDAAAPAFMSLYAPLGQRTPRLPIACCAQRGPLETIGAGTLWRAVREPIWFRDTLLALEASGPYHYVDLGPSGTLATMLKYALAPGTGSEAHAILSPYGHNPTRLEATLRALAGS